MAIINIKSTEEYNKEIASGTVLVDFYADWCGPCKMLAPVLDKLSEENPDLKILEVNVDEQTELAEQFQIVSIPSLLIYKNGTIDKKMVGVQSKPTLEALIK